MSSIFHSEDMSKCQMYVQKDTLYDFVKELGDLAIIQFRDMNPEVNAFQRTFFNQLKRCEEMARQLRYFERELNHNTITIEQDLDANPEAPDPSAMVDLEATFQSQEDYLKDITSNIDALKRNLYELTELKCVLVHAQELFTDSCSLSTDNDVPTQHLCLDVHDTTCISDIEMVDMTSAGGEPSKMKFEFITGVIPLEKLQGFIRTVWLVCRGNVLLRYSDMPETVQDFVTGLDARKSIFVIFFQGKQLESRIIKICEGYRANIYPCPETPSDREVTLNGVIQRIADITTVIDRSQEQSLRILNYIAKNVYVWHMKVVKTKAIWHTMSLFKSEGNHFIGEGWYPTNQQGILQTALKRASQRSQTAMPSLIHAIDTNVSELPTFNQTNKFTKAYQAIIDAYGFSSYKEANPMPFTVITFPFLFGVMFGDAGHGLLMFIFAIWMIWNEKKFGRKDSGNEIWEIFFGGRYIILMMSVFSLYCGTVYNDFFSKSVNVFGSAWTPHYSPEILHAVKELMLDPNDTQTYSGRPYPFGVDPMWQISKNKITFANGFKKKVSIILGVLQMVLGLFLSLANHIHFGNTVNILCEFIPRILFLLGIFGYLVGLMVTKWIIFTPADASCAPSLLLGLINMFLFKYPDEPCSIATWYIGQKTVQVFLLLLVAICIPWMLFIKPYYLKRKHRLAQTKHQRFTDEVNLDDVITDVETGYGVQNHDTEEILPNSVAATPTQITQNSTDLEEFDFGEVMINQCIHTIEFCLGCISHTASYLRLWALSLAHTQLSEVLWNMVFRIGLHQSSYAGAFMLLAVFPPWAFLTVAILILMEGLSAFLHTLRLHWVEFQSKFYRGEGFPFEPFCFKKILSQLEFEK